MSFDTYNTNRSDYAIEVNGLSKCYQIYEKPSDRLKQLLMGERKHYYKEFWALKDVSFKIRKGETVGVIGRNGSGKSTLLQMICGTLNPTAGEIKVNGRVAALLELGSGFNPEFTGVENVYMAASLYGLSREQIDMRFGAITAFADIGDHIHQPVKSYSSGMYVRLAFAVIANVDADVLIIDEALAVGDVFFVQKCMRYLREFANKGTLLFVSHDTSAVLTLCSKAFLMNAGKLDSFGAPKNITERYLAIQHTESTYKNISNQPMSVTSEYVHQVLSDSEGDNNFGTKAAKIVDVGLFNQFDKSVTHLAGGEFISLKVIAEAIENIESPIVGYLIKNRLGQGLFGAHSYEYRSGTVASISMGERLHVEFRFDMPLLVNGDYSVTVSIADGTPQTHVQLDWINDAIAFSVSQEKTRYGVFELGEQSVTVRRFDAAN